MVNKIIRSKNTLLILRALSWSLFIFISFRFIGNKSNLPLLRYFYLLIPILFLSPYIVALPTLLFSTKISSFSITSDELKKPIKVLLYRNKKNKNHNEVSLYARGTAIFLPFIIVKGDFESIPAEQRQALLFHEIAHIKKWDITLQTVLLISSVIFTSNIFLVMAISAGFSRLFEYRADYFAARKTSADIMISALTGIDSKDTMLKIEYVPLLNLFLSHPATSLRIKRLQLLQENQKPTYKKT